MEIDTLLKDNKQQDLKEDKYNKINKKHVLNLDEVTNIVNNNA